MMTIEVYKVDPDGQRTEIRPRYEVGTGDPERLPDPGGFPPCSCRQCRTARAVR